jgi:hypothetical protein
MESVLIGQEVPESSKLQGPQNYAIWSFKVRTVLQREKLWSVVNPDTNRGASDSETSAQSGSGASTTPADNTTTTSTVATAATATRAEAPVAPLITNLEDLRYHAIGIIVPTIRDSLVPHIMNLEDPRLVWIKLRDLFESKSMNRRMSIKSQLYNLKMTEKTTIEEHLRNVSSLIAQLANIGTIVADEELVDRVLTSLPSSWTIFRQMICGRERPLSFIELESLLIQEDGVRTRSREQDENDEAMMLQQDAFYSRFQMPNTGRSGFRGRSSHRGRTNSFQRNTSGGRNSAPNHTPGNHNTNFNRGSNHRFHAPTTFQGIRTNTYGNGSCNDCGSRDHWADRCEIRQLKNKIRDLEISAPTWKKKEWANSTEDHPAGETSNDAALAQVFEVCATEIKSQRQPDDWFIDSGASAHVTGDRNLISDVRNAPQSNVTTAGGRVLPVMGQGSANLDLTKEIQRVLYVPGMYKNLLSVGKFADEGHYTYSGPRNAGSLRNTTPTKSYLPELEATATVSTASTPRSRVALPHQPLPTPLQISFKPLHQQPNSGMAALAT